MQVRLGLFRQGHWRLCACVARAITNSSSRGRIRPSTSDWRVPMRLRRPAAKTDAKARRRVIGHCVSKRLSHMGLTERDEQRSIFSRPRRRSAPPWWSTRTARVPRCPAAVCPSARRPPAPARWSFTAPKRLPPATVRPASRCPISVSSRSIRRASSERARPRSPILCKSSRLRIRATRKSRRMTLNEPNLRKETHAEPERRHKAWRDHQMLIVTEN